MYVDGEWGKYLYIMFCITCSLRLVEMTRGSVVSEAEVKVTLASAFFQIKSFTNTVSGENNTMHAKAFRK